MITGTVDDLLAAITKYLGGFRNMGSHIMVRCPFHGGGQERTPSLSIAPAKGVWYCHACHMGGYVNTLLKKLSGGLDFQFPVTEIHREAETGLEEQLLLQFTEVPPHELVGFDRSVIRKCGVLYDPHRKRVVYPIRDHNWRLKGVVGRLTEEELVKKRIGKYKKYANAEWMLDYVFHKADHLWPLHLEYQQLLLNSKPVVLVEGFKAAMWVRMAGFLAFAVMTAHMSEKQQILIERITNEVILLFDWNAAGLGGMGKAAKALFSSMGVRIAEPEEWNDERNQPDDYPLDEVRRMIEEAAHFAG